MTKPLDFPVLPTPHGEKLNSLAQNEKLPLVDKPRLAAALDRYSDWKNDCLAVSGDREQVLAQLVSKLQEYKLYIDLELIFGSPEDFLYRQKGQTKLDNSIIEEFLPMLVVATFPKELSGDLYEVGPTKCFSMLRFESTCSRLSPGAGGNVKAKDQDFAISRPVYIKTSHYSDFRAASVNESHLAYVASECKTNLDKTMFQEAAATAADVKAAVPGARYYLLCEWLDMTPISTSLTPIDEIIILRKAKRLASNVRKTFSKAAGRAKCREAYRAHLVDNPYAPESFGRLLDHIQVVLSANDLDTDAVLSQGYF